jgi:AhpC/TSA family/Disulphide bond corrector protein DsbC
VELEQNVAQFEKLGLKVAGLSYDTPAVLKNFADRKGIHFPLLADPDSKIITELGLLNEEVPKSSPFFGVPYPGVYILDAKGNVSAKYFEDDFRQRFTAADILVQRFGVVPESRKTEIEGKQLKATATASNAIVRPGQRVALVLDLELKPGMHVYAPGVEGYIPIDWKMAAGDAAEPHDTVYPKPQILFLKAIDEKVPVFQGKIHLTRDITIGPDAKLKPLLDAGGQFMVEGSLRYQACDDRMCYIPQVLPVKWTFQYEAFDRTRVPAELQRKVN